MEARPAGTRPKLSYRLCDVAVVEGAIRRGDAIVTSDDADIRRIAEAAGSAVRIEHA